MRKDRVQILSRSLGPSCRVCLLPPPPLSWHQACPPAWDLPEHVEQPVPEKQGRLFGLKLTPPLPSLRPPPSSWKRRWALPGKRPPATAAAILTKTPHQGGGRVPILGLLCPLRGTPSSPAETQKRKGGVDNILGGALLPPESTALNQTLGASKEGIQGYRNTVWALLG